MNDLFTAALDLADQMIPCFPCNSDKEPIVAGGFQAATFDPQSGDFARAALIGVPTGAASGWDIVDIDPRHGGDVWLEENRHRLPVTRTQTTQSGGLHLYLRARDGMRCSISRIAPGVDVRAEGGYIIAWQAAGLPVEHAETVADWPEWLADAARGSRVRHAENPARSAADLAPPSVEAVVSLLERMPNPDDATRDDYVCVMLAAKGCIDGLDGDGAAEIGEAAVEWAAKWCGSPGYDAESAKWEDDFATRDSPLAGWSNLLAAATRFGVDTVAERADTAAGEFGAVPVSPPDPPFVLLGNQHWKSKLLRTEKGNIKPILANMLLALRESPAWCGVLGYDQFNARAAFVQPPPWHRGPFLQRQVKDVDLTRAAEWAQIEGLNISSALAAEAMHGVAHEQPFHPVRDYLQGLVWDGVPRAESWLIDYLGADDTPLNRAFAVKFLMSAVARAMKPGCQVDTMLVLEGPQGMRKSTALRILAGDDHFTDHLPDLSSKDAVQQLQGVWLLEHAEMASLNRGEVAKVKEFITRRVDRFRPSYGRVADDFPRQCVFAGTVNPGCSGYLRDETGARRFWPVMCGIGWAPGRELDSAALATARDQLWAEAVQRVASGSPWHLQDRSLQVMQEVAAEQRYDADVWTDRIAEIVAGKPFIRSPDILLRLGVKDADMNLMHYRRVSGVMAALGWKQSRHRDGGRLVRGFEPGPNAVTSDKQVEVEITDIM